MLLRRAAHMLPQNKRCTAKTHKEVKLSLKSLILPLCVHAFAGGAARDFNVIMIIADF